MFIDDLIQKKYDKFSETDIQISKYILNNKSSMEKVSITSLAEQSYTSKSSVLRFVQKLGFSGFTEFKFMVNWKEKSLESETFNLEEEVSKATTRLLNKLNHTDFIPMFEQIRQSDNIYLISTGLSQRLQARTMQRDFLKIGISMNMLPAGTNNDLSNAVIEKLTNRDLLIIFSSSGENYDVKEMLSIPLIKSVPIFALTNFGHNWLIEHSTFYFNLGMENEKLGTQEYSSSMVHLTIDYLRISYEKYLKNKIQQERLS